MSWMLSIWTAAALLALCGGQNTVYKGYSLCPSGYHLCIHNETKSVTFLVMQIVPYMETKPCGGWLAWKTCTVTLYKMISKTENKTVVMEVAKCCDGYVQVGRYCALPVNRSGELTAKPGTCPTADGLYPGSEDCEWDMDCPGWQKCCQKLGRSLCIHPASSANDSYNGGYHLNATVTVKVDYQQLMSNDNGLLNHTRILQAMVTGALQMDDISVYYLSSWPVHPYRTATSLLIGCNSTLSLSDVTTKLHLLLIHIQEVSSVTVEDVDECVEPAFPQCSPQADCNNTVGSYQCICRQGYSDVDPSNPGAHCTTGDEVWTNAETLMTSTPSMNTSYIPASNITYDSPGNSTFGFFNSTEISFTTTLSYTSSVSYNSPHVPPLTTSAPHTSMESPLPTTTCSPPSITSLMSSNVTGTSFYVYWSNQFQTDQTYLVILSKGSVVAGSWETNQTMKELRGLNPGDLYNVTVTPHACGSQGVALSILVKTDAQTLAATARFTNIEFTPDLQNTSSEAYMNLTTSIEEEIYRSLSPEIKAMVDSGLVRIQITSFSQGSVVANFIFSTTKSHNISNVSVALLNSLMNSSKYIVDRNSTSISDFDECTSSNHDCSQWANCTNTLASYTCVCKNGYTDNNPDWPGRVCTSINTSETMTPSATSTLSSTVSTVLTSTTNTPAAEITITNPITTANAPTTLTATPVTGASTISGSSPSPNTSALTSIAPILSTTDPIAITSNPLTTTTTPVTTTVINTAPITITTTSIPTTTDTTIITSYPITPSTALVTTTTASVTTTTTPAATTSVAITTTATPVTITTTPVTTTTINTAPVTITTTTTAPVTTSTNPVTTTSAATTSTAAPVTTTTTPTTTTTISFPPTTTSTLPITTTTAMTSMTSSPTTNTAPATNALRTSSMLGSISVHCRVTDITVTVARDFLQDANIQESDLYLGLPECGVNGGNATHVQLTVAWDTCATTLVQNQTCYMASVTLFNKMEPYQSANGMEEVRTVRLELPVMCTYPKHMVISADFGSTGYDMINDVIMGLGSFQVRVQLMNGTVPLPNNYSLSAQEQVVVEVSLNTSSEQIKVVINKCWATSNPNPADIYRYTFLENSCSLNTYTHVLMNGNSSTSRVSVQIFSFVNLNVIYLHCQVHICVQVGSDTCVPDCQQRTARSAKTVASSFGSAGPLFKMFQDPFEQKYETAHIIGFACLGVGLSLFFIFAFICLFYYQRNRIGHYNFSVKPKQENFTYLNFNT